MGLKGLLNPDILLKWLSASSNDYIDAQNEHIETEKTTTEKQYVHKETQADLKEIKTIKKTSKMTTRRCGQNERLFTIYH